ncbi:MAG: hypothetical protein M3H12_02065, partial [Chromatiales bacterium]
HHHAHHLYLRFMPYFNPITHVEQRGTGKASNNPAIIKIAGETAVLLFITPLLFETIFVHKII